MKIALENAQKGMAELIPALALMAPAFWVAWIELIYSGEIYLSANQPTSFEIIVNYALSTTAMSLSLIAFACMPRKAETLLAKKWATPVAGTAATAMTLWGLVAPNACATLLTGVFTSVLVMRFSIVYSRVNPKASMIAIILSQLVASFVYGYVLALPRLWQPLFMCLLPLIAGVCSMFDGQAGFKEENTEARVPSAGFVRFVVALVLFSVALNVVRGFYPSSIEMDAFSDARGNSSVLFFFAKIALALFVLMLPLKANLGKLSYYGFVGLAILTLPLPLIGLQSPAALELFGCVNAVLNIVVWSLFAGIAYKSGRSPIRLMGFGWGFMSLGSVAGWLAGVALYVAGFEREQIAIVEIMLLVVMLLACVFVATWQVVDALFDPFDGNSDECIDRTLGAGSFHAVSRMGEGMSNGSAATQLGEVKGFKAQVAPEDAQVLYAPAMARACSACGFTCAGDASLAHASDDSGLQYVQNAFRPAGGNVDDCAGISDGKAPVAHIAKGRWKRAVFDMATDFELSDREADVMELLLKGYSKQRAAEELFIAYNTVRSHVRKVYVKCDVHSQQELIDLFEKGYLHKVG